MFGENRASLGVYRGSGPPLRGVGPPRPSTERSSKVTRWNTLDDFIAFYVENHVYGASLVQIGSGSMTEHTQKVQVLTKDRAIFLAQKNDTFLRSARVGDRSTIVQYVVLYNMVFVW